MVNFGEKCDGSTRTRIHDEQIGKDCQYIGSCCKCGARRIDSQLGLEKTPEEYVAKLVAVFREVRRVLRDDGTLWLNLGDSYNAGTTSPSVASKHTDVGGHTTRSGDAIGSRRINAKGLKTKDLVGIPWRVAFALQSDGWYLRSDIIWAKPNPMPESVTDRPTKAHEYIFLLTKSPRYYYDAGAVREPAVTSHMPGNDMTDTRESYGFQNGGNSGLRDLRKKYKAEGLPTTRNKRSVWTVPTKPFKGAHFAVFPPKLIEPCILAGCPEGGTVLDPFAGSGTTGQVAVENGCRFVGIELSEEYIRLANRRFQQPLLFANEPGETG